MFKSLLVAVVLLAMSGVASATFVGTGQLCTAVTTVGASRDTHCTAIAPASNFASESSCRLHFERYLKQKDMAVFVADPNPGTEQTHLQADSNKLLLAKGTTTSDLQGVKTMLRYSCTYID